MDELKHSKLSFLKVSGSNYEIGFAIGSHFKEQIITTVKNRKTFLEHAETDRKDPSRIDKMLGLTKDVFPQYMKEMRGIAEGSGLEFREIFIHNAMHMPALANCSTAIFHFSDKTYVAHNEDFDPIMEENIYFLQIEYAPGRSFFAHCYPGVLPGMSNGFNSDGLLITCNFLPDPHKTVGVSRILFGRALFEQPTVKDAIDTINKFTPRTGGASYTITSLKERKVVNVETTGMDSTEIEVTDRFFRANHYISDKFKHHPVHVPDTLIRQEGGQKRIQEVEKTMEGLKQVIWDDSVFLDMEDTDMVYHTNATIFVELTDDIHFKYFRRETRFTEYKEVCLKDLLT